MKLNTMKRHFVQAGKNIFRNGWMTVASVGSLTTTLVLVGLFLTLILNLNSIVSSVEEDIEIKVFLELATEQSEIESLETQISNIPEVSYVEFSSKDNELQALIEELGDDGESWMLFEQDNPLSDAIIVKTEDPIDTENVAKKILNLDHVDDVNYGEAIIQKLFTFNEYARYIGMALVAALILMAAFLISNTIKITIMARSREISIMKLVGATNGFIRWPFFIEGLLMGILGSIIPIAVILVGYNFLYDSLSGVNIPYLKLLPYNPFAYQISLVLLLIGAIIGTWGSLMSVRKFLKV